MTCPGLAKPNPPSAAAQQRPNPRPTTQRPTGPKPSAPGLPAGLDPPPPQLEGHPDEELTCSMASQYSQCRRPVSKGELRAQQPNSSLCLPEPRSRISPAGTTEASVPKAGRRLFARHRGRFTDGLDSLIQQLLLCALRGDSMEVRVGSLIIEERTRAIRRKPSATNSFGSKGNHLSTDSPPSEVLFRRFSKAVIKIGVPKDR